MTFDEWITGKLTREGQTRAMSLEVVNSDFEKVGPLFEPKHQVMRMGGVLSDKEKKQLQEAQAQLEEAKKQMAKLPKAQQDMMMAMMGDKFKMLENMAKSGGIEVETIVDNHQFGTVQEYAKQLGAYMANVNMP